MNRRRPDRRFLPFLEDHDLGPRITPGPLGFGWWTFPQAGVSVTDNGGNIYRPTDAAGLRTVIKDIRAAGGTIDELLIKGHGGSDIIMLTDSGINDSFAVVQEKILIGGVDMTDDLNAVSDADTDIWLTGCGTGGMGAPVSSAAGNDATVWVNSLPYAIGIPWTWNSIGWYSPYSNGSPAGDDYTGGFGP